MTAVSRPTPCPKRHPAGCRSRRSSAPVPSTVPGCRRQPRRVHEVAVTGPQGSCGGSRSPRAVPSFRRSRRPPLTAHWRIQAIDRYGCYLGLCLRQGQDRRSRTCEGRQGWRKQGWRKAGLEEGRVGGRQGWRKAGLEEGRVGGRQGWRKAGLEEGRVGGRQGWRKAGLEEGRVGGRQGWRKAGLEEGRVGGRQGWRKAGLEEGRVGGRQGWRKAGLEEGRVGGRGEGRVGGRGFGGGQWRREVER